MALAEDPQTLDAGPGGLREQILDAAHACVIRYGVPKTTIEDVIKTAGVSRATLYKYVPGGRDELITEVLVREGRRNIHVVLDAIRGEDSVEEQFAAGILAATERLSGDDHLRFLFSPEVVDPRTGIAGAAEAMIDGITDVVGPVLARGREAGLVDDTITDRDTAEWCMRVILSLLTFEGQPGRSRDELREFIRRFAVAPMLNRSPD